MTHNSGDAWTRVGIKRGWSIMAQDLLSPQVGFVLDRTDDSFVMRTTDGGQHWQQISPPRMGTVDTGRNLLFFGK